MNSAKITFWIKILGLFVVSALLIMHNIGGQEFNRYVFLVILVFLFLIGNKSNIYEVLAFITPCISGLPYNHIAIAAITILLLKSYGGKSHYKGTGVLSIIMLILMELLSMARGFWRLNEYLSFVSIFSLVFLRLIDCNDEYNNRRICLLFIAGYWVAVVCLFGQYYVNGYTILEMNQMAENSFRVGDTSEFSDVVNGVRTNITYNSNCLGEVSVVASLISLLLYRKQRKVMLLVSVFCAIAVGITTLSRAFLLTLLLSLVSYFIISSRNRKHFFRNILFMGLFSATLIYIVSNVLNSYIVGFDSRMDVGDISNGRFEIFAQYTNVLFDNLDALLFGVGIQNYNDKLGMFMSSHNGTQEVVIAWGLLGLVLVISLITIAIKNAKRAGAVSMEWYIPFFALLFTAQFGQSFSSPEFILLLFVTYNAIMLGNETRRII